MNVLILTPYHRLGPRLDLEAQTLRNAGYSVKVLGWDRRGKHGTETTSKDEVWVSLKAPLGKLGVLFYLPRLYWAMTQEVRPWNIDIVHCTHLLLLPLALALAKLKRAAVIYDVYERHSANVGARFGPFRRPIKGLVELVEDRMLVPGTRGVLTVDSPGNYLETRYRNRNQNTAVLYNVPSLAQGAGPKVPDIQCEWLTGKRVLIYVGRLAGEIGLPMCIEAIRVLAERFPDVGLLLIGEFEDNYEAETRSLIERYHLSERVYILPWLAYKDMMSYCHRAEVALALYRPDERFRLVSKGTAFKFFTYMESGLPIVATDFAEVAKVVAEEECGLLVDTTDLDTVVGAITYLLEHPDIAREMGMRGQRAILDKYNWETESAKLFKVYEQVSTHLAQQRASSRKG